MVTGKKKLMIYLKVILLVYCSKRLLVTVHTYKRATRSQLDGLWKISLKNRSVAHSLIDPSMLICKRGWDRSEVVQCFWFKMEPCATIWGQGHDVHFPNLFPNPSSVCICREIHAPVSIEILYYMC